MNRIPVVFASDNNYVIPTIVAITSLLINRKIDTFYIIYILDDSISDKNKSLFVWTDFQDSFTLKFISVNLNELKEKNSYGTWVPAIYAKYFICDLLIEYRKCIWLDSDTIILSDLIELYNTELCNNYIAAVKSPGTNYNVAAGKHIVLSGDNYALKCINVGVLVLNLEQLRKLGGSNFFLKETIDTISQFPANITVTEQDMFNKLLVDGILYLPLRYNLFINNIQNNIERHYYPFFFPRNIIEEAFLNPVIVHYTLPEKPWVYSNAKAIYPFIYKKYASLWQDYFNRSPIKIIKLNKKRIGTLRIIYYYLKPLLKQSKFLLKIKRRSSITNNNSQIQDFFD